jgi:hypothetical protein
MKQLVFLCFTILFSSFLNADLANPDVITATSPSANVGLNYLTILEGNNPFDGQNNLYEQIFDSLHTEYQHIGKLSAERVLNDNLVITGGLNSIGFSYRKPFLDFGLSLNRTVAPDLFSSTRWIVTDTMTVHIDASKVLSRLKNENKIDISEKNLALFAGIVFERKYTWFHFANSYEEGLSTQFDKLFFPFLGVKFSAVKKLGLDEFITKEDSISINAGGFVSVPIYTGVSAIGGALAKFQKISRMEITRKSQDLLSDESLMVSFEKTKSFMTGISFQVQADFFKILKMNLLSYDFNYQLDESYKIYSRFDMDEINEMTAENPVAEEISNIIKTKEPNLVILAPYILSEEKKISEILTHKYNFLLLGGIKEAKTQQIEVTSKGVSRNFFRHYYEKIKYTEDLMSRLFTSFIFAIFNSDLKSQNLASETKRVTIEYDSERNLLDTKEDISIFHKDSQVLSLKFEGSYHTKKTSGMFGKKYRDRAKFLIEAYSGVNPVVTQMIDNEDLKAPFDINGQYQINIEGIRYFNNLSVNEVFDNMNSLCDDKPKTVFFLFRNLFDNCRRSLQNNYIDYLKDLSHEKVTAESINTCERKAMKYWYSSSKKRAFIKNCIGDLTYKSSEHWTMVPLWPLKNLSQDLVNNINNKTYYYNLFGIRNVFFHGVFSATTSSNTDFVTYFHEGEFKGLGVVDNYMREQNMRAPASVVVDLK